MGIQGLLPFLKPLVQRRNIREFSGKTIGVDAMCWMHKGAIACSQDLLEGKDTDKFVHFVLRMCEVLRYSQIKPVIVFDGAKLPAKEKEDQRRQEIRETARKEALELLERRAAGEQIDERVLASKCGAAIKVTTEMIARLQSALRELSIKFLVAPYEADAQLAYMCRIGYVHAVISEDSDLLAYGCPNTFFKMDKYGDGECIMLPCLQPGCQGASDPTEGADLEDDNGFPEDDDDNMKDVGAAPQLELSGDEPTAAEPAGTQALEQAVGQKGRGRGRGRGRSRGGAVTARLGRARGRGRDKEAKADEGPPAAPSGVEAAANGHAAENATGTSDATASNRMSGRRGRRAELSLAPLGRWTAERFVEFCVICGTDYKDHDVHIKGFGIKTAYKLLCQFRTALRMFAWMQKAHKWKDKFPCEAEDFSMRFRSIVTVFWHHVVFDPTMAQCASIARSFPTQRQTDPDIDVLSICGAPIPKEKAKQAAIGEIDPRTGKPRPRQPLTPAERAALDRIIAQKRGEQRDFENEHRRKAEGEAAAKRAAERAAEAAARLQDKPTSAAAHGQDEASISTTGAVPSGTDVSAGDDPRIDAHDDEDEAPKPAPIILRGDVKGIFGLLNEPSHGLQKRLATLDPPPSQPPSEPRANPFATSNPFARTKRLAPDLGTEPGTTNSTIIEKRPRLLPTGVRASLSKSPFEAKGPNLSTTVRGGDPKTVTRELAEPRLHPRGGFAAEEAAKTVLMRNGVMEYKKLPEHLDRGKMMFFVSKPEDKKKPATSGGTDPGKESALKRWSARPWEEAPTEEKPVIKKNELSLKHAHGATRLFQRPFLE